MKTMKFRSRPIEIEAWQFTGRGSDKPPKWFVDAYHAGQVFVTLNETKGHYVTLVYNGNSERANPGDWILKDKTKQLRICNANSFEKQYERVEHE